MPSDDERTRLRVAVSRGDGDLADQLAARSGTAAYPLLKPLAVDLEGDDDPARWLGVRCEGSRDGFRDMELFVADLTDPDVADRLEASLHGRGAFRRFRDHLSRWPELLDLWYAFSDDRKRGRARAWLSDEGYAALPQRHDVDLGLDPP